MSFPTFSIISIFQKLSTEDNFSFTRIFYDRHTDRLSNWLMWTTVIEFRMHGFCSAYWLARCHRSCFDLLTGLRIKRIKTHYPWSCCCCFFLLFTGATQLSCSDYAKWTIAQMMQFYGHLLRSHLFLQLYLSAESCVRQSSCDQGIGYPTHVFGDLCGYGRRDKEKLNLSWIILPNINEKLEKKSVRNESGLWSFCSAP